MPQNVISVFLIDDDKDDIEIFELALNEVDRAIKLITANGGNVALEMLKADINFIPDIIFLDINMSVMDGHKCLKEIKKLGHLHHIPIFIYTTSLNPVDKDSIMKAGAKRYISKPFSISALVEILKPYFLSNNNKK